MQLANVNAFAAPIMAARQMQAQNALARLGGIGYPMRSYPSGDMASRIYSGLVQRGLPEHVAHGFVMNMKDESGLNPGINEIAPLVPGSRGGFGLYQLTGPRRREFEAFAARRGVAPDDVDAQLDFLVSELQGSERRAAQSIFSTRTPGEAAGAIVRDFLRPAPQHMNARYRRYLSTGAQDAAPRRPMPAINPDTLNFDTLLQLLGG